MPDTGPTMTKGPQKRDVRFSLRIPASVHVRIRKASEADRRSMADFVLIAIEKALDTVEHVKR
jgi:uncharacterized protein (DUF1778 family)